MFGPHPYDAVARRRATYADDPRPGIHHTIVALATAICLGLAAGALAVCAEEPPAVISAYGGWALLVGAAVTLGLVADYAAARARGRRALARDLARLRRVIDLDDLVRLGERELAAPLGAVVRAWITVADLVGVDRAHDLLVGALAPGGEPETALAALVELDHAAPASPTCRICTTLAGALADLSGGPVTPAALAGALARRRSHVTVIA